MRRLSGAAYDESSLQVFPVSFFVRRKQVAVVSKLNLFAVSLVAAVPGAVLVWLLVSAFLGSSEMMGGTLLAVSAVSLLAAATVLFLPVGILIFTPSGETATETEKSEDEQDEQEAGESEDLEMFDETPSAAEGEEIDSGDEVSQAAIFDEDEAEAAAAAAGTDEETEEAELEFDLDETAAGDAEDMFSDEDLDLFEEEGDDESDKQS